MSICKIKNLFKAMEFLAKIGIDLKKNSFAYILTQNTKFEVSLFIIWLVVWTLELKVCKIGILYMFFV